MLIQNTNPMNVCPDQELVRRGFQRDDLFTVVHEQFMTDTAQMADLVLPATMFFEHDDLYSAGGHQHIQLGLKALDPPGECRTNHEVISAIARAVGAEHQGFAMSEREIIDWTLQNSGWGSFEDLAKDNFRDVQPPFDEAHYIKGFAYPDGKFRFRPDWSKVPFAHIGMMGPAADMPVYPDFWGSIEQPDAVYPFRLATSPSRSFLNSTFAETKSSQKREGEPSVMMHPDDAARLGLADGEKVRVGSRRGEVRLKVQVKAVAVPGILIAEGIWPNAAHEDGKGINTLTGG